MTALPFTHPPFLSISSSIPSNFSPNCLSFSSNDLMLDDMNLSINGQSQVPPGFRFHPTEEELLHYYLRKKVAFQKIDLDVIRDVDLNKLEPWDIQEKCKIGTTPQNDWYFFSHKDKKYPTGTRTNRATAAGFWKATGRDKIIYSGLKRIGSRKTLVFYKGRAPHGQKSNWIMHEYRLDETSQETCVASNHMVEPIQEEGWVVCRVFKKKNYQKTINGSPKGLSRSLDSKTNHIIGSSNDEVLDQILLYMGRTCKTENESLTQMNQNTNTNTSRFLSTFNNEGIINERFSHLPRLVSPTLPHFQLDQNLNILENNNIQGQEKCSLVQEKTKPGLSDWATFDRLVASQLNGLAAETSKQLSCFTSEPSGTFGSTNEEPQLYINDNNLWSFTKSSSSPSPADPLCHLSV